MRKPELTPVGGESVLATLDRDAFKEWPGLRSFFLSTCYDDGATPREPGCLIVRPDGSRWTWILKDPAFATQLLVAGQTWDEVQLLAESLLLDPRAPWVPDPYALAKRKKVK